MHDAKRSVPLGHVIAFLKTARLRLRDDDENVGEIAANVPDRDIDAACDEPIFAEEYVGYVGDIDVRTVSLRTDDRYLQSPGDVRAIARVAEVEHETR